MATKKPQNYATFWVLECRILCLSTFNMTFAFYKGPPEPLPRTTTISPFLCVVVRLTSECITCSYLYTRQHSLTNRIRNKSSHFVPNFELFSYMYTLFRKPFSNGSNKTKKTDTYIPILLYSYHIKFH